MPPCPCSSELDSLQCCERFLTGEVEPETPEQLMRSRFVAFQRQNAEHLARTLHPDADDSSMGVDGFRQSFKRQGRRTVYRSLQVLDAPPPVSMEVGSEAHVLFYADIRSRGKDASFAEASTFVRTEHGWRYLCGVVRTAAELKAKRLEVIDLTLATFG